MTTPEERRLGVEMAFANNRLEGLDPSAASVRDAEQYIAGDLTLDDLIERARREFQAQAGSEAVPGTEVADASMV